jgi:type I restriction enzyme S subunit
VAPTYAEDDTGFVAFSQKCVLGNGRVDAALGRPMADPGEALADARLKNGDVVVNSTGTGTLGRAGLVVSDTDEPPAVLVADGHVTVIRTDDRSLLPKFLAYLLQTDSFMQVANECLAVGSTNQMELGRDSLRTLGFRIPSREAQRQIVKCLDIQTGRVDELIRELQLQTELLNEHRQALIVAAVTGHLAATTSAT